MFSDKLVEGVRRRSRFLTARCLTDIKLPVTTEYAFIVFMRPVRLRKLAVLLSCAFLFQPNQLTAEQIPVRHKEGLMHGFLALRTLEGKKPR
jgi:hypothetical protein